MKYTVYKITNLINGKIYVGVHKTNDLEDDYMGSGINIKRAINKYGLDSFKKEYLAIFDNESEMFEMESQIVNEEFVTDKNTYNILKGGLGSFDYINNVIPEEQRKQFKSQAGSWNDKDKRRKVWDSVTLEKRQEIGNKMGSEFGGQNKLTEDEITNRLNLIKEVDLMKLGWVKKVSDILGITHTQTRRFIEKHYIGEYYRRK